MRAILPVKRPAGIRRNSERNHRAVSYARDVGFGNWHHEPQPVVLYDANHRRRRGRAAVGPDERTWMDVSLGHHAGERGGDAQVPFHLRD